MNDKQLAAFISVAESGSFSAAARKQYISPQAIIQQIDLLESEIGVKLLSRTHRGVTLTDAGKQYYTGIVRLTQQHGELLEQVRKTQKQNHQRLNIGIYDSSQIMNPICRSFSEHHPEIRQKYTIMKPENWLEDLELLHKGKLDIFEHAEVPEIEQAGLCFFPLIHSPNFVLLSPSHPLARKSLIDPADLSNHTIGIHDKECVKGLEAFIYEQIPGATLLSEKYGPISAYEICDSGGVFLTYELSIARYHPLIAIPFDCDLTWSFGFVYKPNPSPLVQLFIDNAKAQYPQTHESAASI